MTGMKHAGRAGLRSLPLLLALFVFAPASPGGAQTRQSAPDDPLFRTLAALDARLFEAYNTCDLETFASLFAEDVEFYHDKGGVTRGRQALVDAVKKNICGKTRRDLIPGTMEVHPMDGFGALQIGAHRFCEAKLKHCDGTSGGAGKFIHLWQNSGGAWKITRAVSYDHAPAQK
jgi:ketosteroid isomerase-like protein